MKRSVHVGVWKVAEPLWVLLLDLVGRETLQLLPGGCIRLKEALFVPSCLVLLFEGYQVVSFSGLGSDQ